MADTRIIVDHLRLNYSGPFDMSELFRLTNAFWKERGYDLHSMKEFEHDLKSGKHVEWQLRPWKQVTHDMRYLIKIRVLIYHYRKSDAVAENRKVKMGHGKAVIYIDGVIDYDQWAVWEGRPFLHFMRTLYLNFIFKIYTERFEQRLNYDVNHFYDALEKFFNVYRHYKVVSELPPFAKAE